MKTTTKAVAIDVDGALADTRPLWREWLADVARRARVDEELPADPTEAAGRLDELVGNWRPLLERYAEEHGPVHFRRSAEAAEALRRLQAAGVVVGAFTESPEPLARVALAQLGAARRIAAFEAGPNALPRLLERLGSDALVVRTRAELARLA
jgi:phosphoglycolate phosphatase-like HAD superfamily hydrolase